MEVGTLKFTWKIKNFSKLQTPKLDSDVFSLGHYKWTIEAYPKGDNVNQDFSIYLSVADPATLPSGWSRNVEFSLTLIDQVGNESSITKRSTSKRKFDAMGDSRGFTSFISQKELHDPNKGYLVDDTCIIEADVTMYEEDASVDSQGSSKLEEDMNTFFVDLNSVIFPEKVVSFEEEAKEALTLIEEALSMTPAEISNRMSQLEDAFDALSSLDDCSILASEQKKELVSIKEKFIDLSKRAAQAVRDKDVFNEKKLAKKALDHKLGRCLIKFEKAKEDVIQNEQDIAILQEQISEKTRKKEDSILKQKEMFKQSKELKAELDVLVKHWPVYEARMNAAEEEEKVVGTDWSKLKQRFSSIKKQVN